MRNDDPYKLRGKTKRLTKPWAPNTDISRVADFKWGEKENRPRYLIAFNEPKGQWTYPKKGFIQWKKQ